MAILVNKIRIVLESGDEHGNVTHTRSFGARFLEDHGDITHMLARFASNTIYKELPGFIETITEGKSE